MTGPRERNRLYAIEVPKRYKTTREGMRDELGLDLKHNVLSWDPKGIHGSHVGEMGSFPLAIMIVDLVVPEKLSLKGF